MSGDHGPEEFWKARLEKSESEPAPAGGSVSKPLFVEARIYNERGSYRVVSIGGNGDCNSDMDGAKILRELASFVETRWKRNEESESHDQ